MTTATITSNARTTVGGLIQNAKTGQSGRIVAVRLIKAERKNHYCGRLQWAYTEELTIDVTR